MVKVKICGITNLSDALLAIEAGADMLGFNFYRPSARFIEPQMARVITDSLQQPISSSGRNISLVGVYVNEPSPETLIALAQIAGLDAVQLHGSETPEFAKSVKDRFDGFVIKAFRVGGQFDPRQTNDYDVDAVMLDGFHPDLWGGAGAEVDRDIARQVSRLVPKMFLAGGLSPENVAAAVAEVNPFAVDACSALESTPGHKDAERVRQFVRIVRSG